MNDNLILLLAIMISVIAGAYLHKLFRKLKNENEKDLFDERIKYLNENLESLEKTKNEEICELDSLKNFKSGAGYSGTDICYYKIVTENANLFSIRWYEKDIIRLCQKIKDSDLRDKCFSAKRFAKLIFASNTPCLSFLFKQKLRDSL